MRDFIEHGSAEWFEARCGRVTASRVYDATKKLKNGAWSSDRATYMTELAVERLTGVATVHFVNDAMKWGIEQEPNARAAHEYLLDVEVLPAGFQQHPRIYQSGATPDGLVGADGLCEYKCPTSRTHLETIMSKQVDQRYIAQMAWQLACFPERSFVDFVTFDPRMPPNLRLWVFRFERAANEKYIAQLEEDVAEFVAELDEMIEQLKQRAA